MARPKAKECDKCAHYRFGFDASRCAKGHSPRFYRPRADQQHVHGGGTWGWMRVCDDFEARAGVQDQ